MSIESFISENFLTPMCRYYTPIGTITYGIILILAVLGTYKLLKRLKIKIDKRFFIGILPFIIYGGWTRALRDHMLGIYQSNFFCSPPIYFVIFAMALGSLLIGIVVAKKSKNYSYEKVMLMIGLSLLIYNASLTAVNNITGFSMVLGLVSFWSIVFFGINRLKPKLLSLENAGIIVSHLLDASSTFVAVTFFGYYEQHVLPSFLIDLLGTWTMFPLKIVVVWIILHIIDESDEDVLFKRFLKIIILILGLALGIRDFLTVSMLSY